MTDIAQVLRDARALIDTPDKWARGWCARLGSGKSTYAADPDAHSFCAVGSLCKADPNRSEEARGFLQRFLPFGFLCVPDFNDHPDTTHADVMALFDRAIAAAELEAES